MAVASGMRSFWKGHLRLALVTIPIRLISAAASEDKIALHQVDKKSKQRIRYQKIASESGKVVPQDDIVQGFELEDGNYVLLDDGELSALKLNSKHTVDLVEFVDEGGIDPLYFETPYYVVPDGDMAEEGYRVIRDALRQTKKIGVGQLTLRGRENLVALKALDSGLLLQTLRYESEVRKPEQIFAGIRNDKLRPGLIEMARQLIEERASTFDPGEYKNHYAEALRELVAKKRAGGEVVDVAGGEEPSSGAAVIDFMEALRRSTEKSSGKPGKEPAPAKTDAAKADAAKPDAAKAASSKAKPRTKVAAAESPAAVKRSPPKDKQRAGR